MIRIACGRCDGQRIVLSCDCWGTCGSGEARLCLECDVVACPACRSAVLRRRVLVALLFAFTAVGGFAFLEQLARLP